MKVISKKEPLFIAFLLGLLLGIFISAFHYQDQVKGLMNYAKGLQQNVVNLQNKCIGGN